MFIHSYFKVIALKLSDGKLTSLRPDSYNEGDLVTYDEAKSSSPPKPYVAAVFTMSTGNEFKLGDGSSSRLPTRRRRRSSSDTYRNGPLDPGTSYSVFQRVYIEKVIKDTFKIIIGRSFTYQLILNISRAKLP